MPYVYIAKTGPNSYSVGRSPQLKQRPDELAWSYQTEHDGLLELLLRQKLQQHASDGNYTSYEVEPSLLQLYLEDVEQVLSWHIQAQENTDNYAKNDSTTTILTASDEAKQLFLQLDALKKKMAILECEKEFLENRIKALIGNAAGIQGVATWKTSTITRLDSDAVKTHHPEIYASYLKETKSRRFLLAKLG